VALLLSKVLVLILCKLLEMINTLPILDQLPKKVYYLPTVTHQVIEQSSDLKQLLLCLPNCRRKCRREDNKTNSSVFLRKIVNYLYGGDSFDNMEDFFGGNGYKIIDKNIATR
jgi:hypothetical protein